MFYVENVVVSVGVDARYLDLVAGPADVDVVAEKNYFFGGGHSSRGHRAGGLLQSDFLEVSVNCGFVVDFVVVFHLTGSTSADFFLVWVCVQDGLGFLPAASAGVDYFVELRVDLRPFCDDALDLD